MEFNGSDKVTVQDMDHAKVFTGLYDRYYLSIYYFTHRYIENEEDAKDVIAETFLKLWKVRDKIAGIENIEGYIKRMAFNASMDYLKKQSNKSKVYQDLLQSGPVQAYELDGVRVELMEYVTREIEKMPAKYQLVYKLFFVDGLNNDEVSEQIQLSPSRVRDIRLSIVKEIRYSLDKKKLLAMAIIVFLQNGN